MSTALPALAPPKQERWFAFAQDRETRRGLEDWGRADTAVYDLSRTFHAVTEPLYSDNGHLRGGRGYQLLYAELERQGLAERTEERYQKWETAR